MKRFKVDGRGLDCPKPLLRTKEAVEKEEFDSLTVLVGNVPARENIVRYLGHASFENIEWSELENGEYSVSAIRSESSASDESDASAGAAEPGKADAPRTTAPAEAGGKTVLIASTKMGVGKKDLGRLLMKGYIYTLTQLDTPPACVIFMNTGVKLSLDDSESLEDLRTLEEMGVRILVCGTCLDFLNVRERMKIGRISNMYEIAGELHAPAGVISLT